MRALVAGAAGAAIAGAGIWGGLQLAKSKHPILAFFVFTGGIAWGGRIAYTGITGADPYAGLAAFRSQPQFTQGATEVQS